MKSAASAAASMGFSTTRTAASASLSPSDMATRRKSTAERVIYVQTPPLFLACTLHSSSAAFSRPTSVTTPPSTQTGSLPHTAPTPLSSTASTQWPASCPPTTTSTSTRPLCSQDQVRSDDIHPQSSRLIHPSLIGV